MPLAGSKVVGLAGVQKAIREAGDPNKALKEASQKSAQLVLELAKQPGYAPVRSGKLRRSLKLGRGATTASVIGGGASVPYANPIHWGWFVDRERNIRKNIMPNPFLYKALDKRREEVFTTYFEIVGKELEKITEKQRATVR